MNNKFTIIIPLLEDILKFSKTGSIKWMKLNKNEEPKNFPATDFIMGADAFCFQAGEDNKFTCYLKKNPAPKGEESYRFIACDKNSVLFLVDSDDLDNPFILEAMYDSAFNQRISEIVSEIYDSIKKPDE